MILEIIIHFREATEPVNILYIKWMPSTGFFVVGSAPQFNLVGIVHYINEDGISQGRVPGCEYDGLGSGIV